MITSRSKLWDCNHFFRNKLQLSTIREDFFNKTQINLKLNNFQNKLYKISLKFNLFGS